MGKGSLVKAVLILTAFYIGIVYIVFLLMPPSTLVEYFDSVPGWMQVRSAPEWMGPLGSAEWQITLLQIWTLPLFVAWCMAVFLGMTTAWCILHIGGKRHVSRASPTGPPIDGCTWTLGTLLKRELPFEIKPVSVSVPGVKLDRVEQRLADEMMGLISARPDSFAGDGHGVTLYEHTLNLLDILANRSDATALLTLAAIGHDIGKTVSYRVIEGEWERISDHSLASGRLLEMLPAYKELERAKAIPLFNAVRYSHALDQMPVNMDFNEQSNDLIDQLKSLDRNATKEEKKRVIEQCDPQEETSRVFWSSFGEMQFYRRNMAPGETTVGWRNGSKIFFNEQALRAFLNDRLDRDIAAALGKIRKKGKIAALTQNLLAKLDQDGYLIRSIRNEGKHYELPADSALWTARCGKIDFNGIFIVDVSSVPVTTWPEAAPFNVFALGPANAELHKLATVQTSTASEGSADKDGESSHSQQSKRSDKQGSESDTDAAVTEGKPKQDKADSRRKRRTGDSGSEKRTKSKDSKASRNAKARADKMLNQKVPDDAIKSIVSDASKDDAYELAEKDEVAQENPGSNETQLTESASDSSSYSKLSLTKADDQPTGKNDQPSNDAKSEQSGKRASNKPDSKGADGAGAGLDALIAGGLLAGDSKGDAFEDIYSEAADHTTAEVEPKTDQSKAEEPAPRRDEATESESNPREAHSEEPEPTGEQPSETSNKTDASETDEGEITDTDLFDD